MNLNDLHRRLLRDVLEIGNSLPFVIAGGYAVQAHAQEEIAELRRWAQTWADDIRRRRSTENFVEDDEA